MPERSRACETCGSEIPPERLELYPDATLCVACKDAEERKPPVTGPGSPVDATCPLCGHKLVWRKARDPDIRGYFLGCSTYPACNYIDPETRSKQLL